MYFTKSPIHFEHLDTLTLGSNHLTSVFVEALPESWEGRKIHYCIYEAYELMAEKIINRIISAAMSQWPALQAIQPLQRLGRVGPGDPVLAVYVQSADRDIVQDALKYVLHEYHSMAPIWRQKHFEDGTNAWFTPAQIRH